MSKEEILHLADLQLRTGGYDSLSFREIAEELGITKANVHHHFKSKENLALQVAQNYIAKDLREIKDVATKHGHNFLSCITELEELFWRKAKEVKSCSICVCTQLAHFDNVPESLQKISDQHFQEILMLMSNICINAEKTGQFREGIKGVDVGTQVGIFMQGVMSMGSALPSVEVAEQMMRGQAVKWARSLIKQ